MSLFLPSHQGKKISLKIHIAVEESRTASLPEKFLSMPWAMALLFPWKMCNRKWTDKAGSRATYYRKVTCTTALPFVTLQHRHICNEGWKKLLLTAPSGQKQRPVGCSTN